MIVILLSLLPLISWGAGDYIAARASRKVNAFTVSLLMMFVGFAVTVPMCFVLGFPEISLRLALLFLAASVGFNSGFLLMLCGFQYGPVGIVAPIANSYALVVTLYALLFQNAALSFGVLVGIVGIIIGLCLVSYSKPKPGEFKSVHRTLLYAMLAHLMFGFAFVFLDAASTQAWYQNTTVLQTTGIIVALTIWLLFQRKDRGRDLKRAVRMPWLYVGGMAGTIGIVGMNAAFARVDTIAVPTAIAAAAPLVTALLAYSIDREHLTIIQRVATACIVAGIIVLGAS